jgi:trigger factor
MQKESMRQMGIEDESKKPPAEDFTEMAEKRVRLGLLLSQVIEDNSLAVDSKRVQNRVEEMCAGYEDPSKMIEQYLSNKQFLTQIQTIVLEEQAIDLLVEKGKEKVNKVSFNDYMNS